MRYLTISGIMLLSMHLTSAVSPQTPIFGIEPNYLAACVAVMTLCEGTLTPALIGGGAALLMDCLFAGSLGFYSAPMLCAGLFAYLLGARFSSRRHMAAVITGAGAWFICELISCVLCIFAGHSIEIGRRLLTVTLPGLPLHALISLLIYYLLALLYKRPYMKPLRTAEDEALIK